MGFSGINIWQLLVILAIVLLVFGSKKLGSLGSDLGSAIKGFRKAIDTNGNSEDEVSTSNDSLKKESANTEESK